jgi:hypothetical protein
MEPIKTAPKDGGPVWAQIADFMTEEEMRQLGIELTPFTTRETRRTWIYWAEPGLPSCNPGGHWAVVSPDFEIRRYNFFVDGWFPQFTPARTSQDAKPDPTLTNPIPQHTMNEAIDLFKFANQPRKVLVTYRNGNRELVKIKPAGTPHLDRVVVSFEAVARALENENDARVLRILERERTTWISNLYEADGRVNNHQHGLDKDHKHGSDIVAVHA